MHRHRDNLLICLKSVILLFIISYGVKGDVTTWLAETWSRAGEASKQASSALYKGMKDLACLKVECCSEDWRPANYSRLEQLLEDNLVGQHIAKDIILRAIKGHQKNLHPSKPLVLSFHGWTGSGKNFVSQFIADSFYKLGFRSRFVHLFIATLHFSDTRLAGKYKEQLRDWISSNGTACTHNIFIFDEVDKMPAGVLDVVKPFLDHYEHIDGVDYRKNIFLFLSNTGGKEITQTALGNWNKGNDREKITVRDLEQHISAGAFNEEGGLQYSRMIEKNLVDVFVPFLPLERRHVKICIRNEFNKRNIIFTEEMVDKVAEELIYWPSELKLFSTSGCKRVAQKVDLIVEDLEWDKDEL